MVSMTFNLFANKRLFCPYKTSSVLYCVPDWNSACWFCTITGSCRRNARNCNVAIGKAWKTTTTASENKERGNRTIEEVAA